MKPYPKEPHLPKRKKHGFNWSREWFEVAEDQWVLRYELVHKVPTGHIANYGFMLNPELPRQLAAYELRIARRELKELVAVGPPQC